MPSTATATWRDEAADVARSTVSDLVALRCDAPPDTAARRLMTRAPLEASDATPDIASAMATVAAPWPDAVVVDTSCALVRSRAVRRRRAPHRRPKRLNVDVDAGMDRRLRTVDERARARRERDAPAAREAVPTAWPSVSRSRFSSPSRRVTSSTSLPPTCCPSSAGRLIGGRSSSTRWGSALGWACCSSPRSRPGRAYALSALAGIRLARKRRSLVSG